MTVHVTCQRPICSAEKVQFNSCRISQRQLPNTKSKHKFSTLAHDQVREQLNAIVKGDGGIIGITVNDAVLGKWMIAGPETTRIFMD